MDKKKIIIVIILVLGIYFLIKYFSKKKLKEIFDNINFNTGNSIILDSSYPYLDELTEILKQSNYKLKLTGHTDNVGSESDNLILSKQRADAVKFYLVSKGIDSNRIETIGLGESMPIADNSTEDGREKNRRVEFLIVK